ncbi:Leucine rich repeat N-terminal domain [Seminavis robusta]|uniref:Leucine rich repeat N-terminal domain n=1 Tax=Seminavis robusta TaxID=568900 RepID=A0A9N8EBA4_9STRA|nr:Leucine rich repeat N-terminal domain [Seminavis robusta]|eukprot:Sro701_g189810.1 Leucine rich repeat N-terminal domain (458) ;mRNA; f:30024-31476
MMDDLMIVHNLTSEDADEARNFRDADGGLSEESAQRTNPRNVLIRDLGNEDPQWANAPPSMVDDAGQNPTLASSLTGPTVLDQLDEAGEESAIFPSIPRNIHVEEEQPPLDDGDDEDRESDPWTATGQFSDPTAERGFLLHPPAGPDEADDASEESASFPSIPRNIHVEEEQPPLDDEAERDPRTYLEPLSTVTGQYSDPTAERSFLLHPPAGSDEVAISRKPMFVLWLVALLVLVSMTLLYAPVHREDRTKEVLSCASILSQQEISQDGTPLRWNAARYIIEGQGIAIGTSGCHLSGSVFATAYAMIVLRESLHVKNPTWHRTNKNITSIDDLCPWKHAVCRGNQITSLIFNNAGLFGTLPPELHLLRHLEFFDVNSNNALVGQIPSTLGLMTNLQDLFLQQSSLSGSIPTELGRLSSLRRVLAYTTNLTGTVPKEICSRSDLQIKAHIPCNHLLS